MSRDSVKKTDETFMLERNAKPEGKSLPGPLCERGEKIHPGFPLQRKEASIPL